MADLTEEQKQHIEEQLDVIGYTLSKAIPEVREKVDAVVLTLQKLGGKHIYQYVFNKDRSLHLNESQGWVYCPRNSQVLALCIT